MIFLWFTTTNIVVGFLINDFDFSYIKNYIKNQPFYLLECSPDEFQCTDLSCIYKNERCDSLNQCPMLEDEQYCGTKQYIQ